MLLLWLSRRWRGVGELMRGAPNLFLLLHARGLDGCDSAFRSSSGGASSFLSRALSLRVLVVVIEARQLQGRLIRLDGSTNDDGVACATGDAPEATRTMYGRPALTMRTVGGFPTVQESLHITIEPPAHLPAMPTPATSRRNSARPPTATCCHSQGQSRRRPRLASSPPTASYSLPEEEDGETGEGAGGAPRAEPSNAAMDSVSIATINTRASADSDERHRLLLLIDTALAPMLTAIARMITWEFSCLPAAWRQTIKAAAFCAILEALRDNKASKGDDSGNKHLATHQQSPCQCPTTGQGKNGTLPAARRERRRNTVYRTKEKCIPS